jgi:hypothetical protein
MKSGGILSASLAALACSAMAMAVEPRSAYAQTTPVIVAPTPQPAVVAERRVLPNPTLLGAGIGTLILSYGPAVVVGAVSDHKGDDNLFIPVAGPWIDLANRDCTGPTIQTSDGPYDLGAQQTCGTSGIESAALITDGIVQGIGALQVVGSLFIPQRRIAVAGTSSPVQSVAVTPSSFGGRGAGIVAGGRF